MCVRPAAPVGAIVRAMPRPWLAFLLAACSATAPKPVPLPPPAPPPIPVAETPKPPPQAPELRLPTAVRPTHNTVDLTIDPATEDFTGAITTTLEITAPTDVIWLNGDEITITQATVDQGGAAQTATVTNPKKGYLGLSFPHALTAGAGTLAITYRGKMHRNDGDGIYTAQEAGDWYAFTQFESTDARQAFPTFDEPSFKVPWKLTIHTREQLVAVANTPIESVRPEASGMKAVAFAETKPLPSYLVAFAVGPFDVVEAGQTKAGMPIRIVVPRGRAADAAYPAKVTADLLDRLEQYFGTPYPYAKLDIVAVSVFNAGAMENAGLITFRQSIVLIKPEEMTQDRQERYATVAAHEMAHQWFGDLVTLAWWDDTWLNESFASWMESKIVEAWKPEWELDVDVVAGKSGVMRQDSLDTARAIRQKIDDERDIENAFDGITYGKGEAVLTMLEKWIGADTFQKGVRAYLAKHAWGNATYDDFVGAMSDAAGKDLHPLFDSFVLQSGLPYVSVKLECAKSEAPKLQLAQQRYAPVGSQIDPKRTWTLPMCVKWRAGKDTGRDCGTLSDASGSLALSAKTCPSWVLPNDGEVFYYRPKLAGADLDHLLAHARDLTLGERVGLVGDIDALVASGDAQPATALALVTDLAKDRSRHMVGASIGIVGGIDDMVPDKLRPNYERLIRKLYQARAHELGWHSKPSESTDAKELRPALLGLVAANGKDKQLIDEATALTWKWFDDHKAIEPELVGAALHVAARYGDQKLFDRIHTEAKKTGERDERARLLGALGAFLDPKLVDQAMALVLTDEFDLRDSGGLLQGIAADPQLKARAYKFVMQHFDEIAAKLPPAYRTFMAYFAIPMCDDSIKDEVQAFLKPKIEPLDGGPRALAQAMEQLTLCAAGRKARTPGVLAFLAKQ